MPTGLRDRLREQAVAHGRTLGEHLEALAQAREGRFHRVRRQMAQSPPDEEYLGAAADRQGDGWS